MIVTTNGTSVFKNGAYDNTVEQLNKAGVASVLFNEVAGKPFKIYSDEWCCVCKGKSV